MPSRRERAIERAKRAKIEEQDRTDARIIWPISLEEVLDAYEVELAADLESGETVDRAVRAFVNPAGIAKVIPTVEYERTRRLMAAALKAALEER